jgi:hypothetical protein
VRDDELTAAVAGLYRAFAAVPKPVRLDYCDHCFLAEEEQALLAAVPLTELSGEALQPYAANVIFTVGGPDDYRYFLPRLLELVARGEFDWPDLEMVIGRLRFAQWDTWQAGEQDAIREYLRALWHGTLREDGRDAGDVLCAIGNAEDDLTPYLDAWIAAMGTPAAREHLLVLLTGGRQQTKSGGWRLINAFWDERAAQAGQVLAWLAGLELLDAVAGHDDLLIEVVR